MERERTGALHPEHAVSGRRSPAELAPLIAEAHAATIPDRVEIAGRINDLLIALRAPGNEDAEAKAILAALDVSQLNGLVDGKGRDCRKEAVETLLACGFPHALSVSPEDLAHARQPASARPSGGEPLGTVKLGGWVALLTALWQLGTAAALFRYVPSLALLLGAGGAAIGIAGQRLVQAKANDSLGLPYALLAAGVLSHVGLMVMGYGGFPWIVGAASALSAGLATHGMTGARRDRT